MNATLCTLAMNWIVYITRWKSKKLVTPMRHTSLDCIVLKVAFLKRRHKTDNIVQEVKISLQMCVTRSQIQDIFRKAIFVFYSTKNVIKISSCNLHICYINLLWKKKSWRTFFTVWTASLSKIFVIFDHVSYGKNT